MSQAGEKTEQPTAKRLRDARRKGQVARSHDLSSAVLSAVGRGVLQLLAHRAARPAGDVAAREVEHRDRDDEQDGRREVVAARDLTFAPRVAQAFGGGLFGLLAGLGHGEASGGSGRLNLLEDA